MEFNHLIHQPGCFKLTTAVSNRTDLIKLMYCLLEEAVAIISLASVRLETIARAKLPLVEIGYCSTMSIMFL